jgi:hypothetical protein
VPSVSQGSGKVSLRKGSKVVKAKAPAPTVDELTKQVSLLKKQLGEVQLEAVRCHELELGASALQQEVVSLREELARSEARGREERKEHCSAQVEQLLQLVLVRAELQAAETQASAERAANCQARRVAKHKHPHPLPVSLSLPLVVCIARFPTAPPRPPPGARGAAPALAGARRGSPGSSRAAG